MVVLAPATEVLDVAQSYKHFRALCLLAITVSGLRSRIRHGSNFNSALLS